LPTNHTPEGEVNNGDNIRIIMVAKHTMNKALIKGQSLNMREKQGVKCQREIYHYVNLCTERGDLNPDSIGWGCFPFANCNLTHHTFRKKKWNYWAITSPESTFSATIANVDYLGLVGVSLLDYESQKVSECGIATPLGIGCNMPPLADESVSYKMPGLQVSFIEEKGYTLIKSACSNLKAELKVFKPIEYETLNVVVPWSKRQFQFTSKQTCLPVEGWVKAGDKLYEFNPQSSFGCLDFGRGIWPYHTTWNWANASGIDNGHMIGLNFGGKWTDGTGANENGLLFDGKLIKYCDDVVFNYDPQDFMKPWTIQSVQTDSIDLIFIPFYERKANISILVLKSETHQLFGFFSGTVKNECGEVYVIKHLLGWSEEYKARW